MEFKCKLKVILAEKDIKHGDFAKKIGISRAAISGLLNNKSLPSFETAYLICQELNMDFREIWIRQKQLTADDTLNDYFETLEFSPRAENALRRIGIVTVRDLINTDIDFKTLRGIGVQFEEEIINKIEEINKELNRRKK